MLYAFGAKTEGGKYLNDLVIIDATTGEVRCRNLTGAPPPRAFHSSVYMLATNEIAVIGGNTESSVVGDVHIFEVGTETWLEPRGNSSKQTKVCHLISSRRCSLCISCVPPASIRKESTDRISDLQNAKGKC
jgi:hypothetical protein